MKIIFKFEAFSPDPEDSYKQIVYVEAESRLLARKYLQELGFFDIEDCGHTSVYVMS